LITGAGARAGAEIDLPVYSVTKHDGFVASRQYFKKQVYSRDLGSYKRVTEGQFAYATIHLDEGSIGIAPEPCLISPMYTVFEVDESQVDQSYLLRFMKSPRALSQYPRFGKGTVHRRKSISLTALSDLVVPLPPLDEQRRIAAILDQADALRAKRRRALTYLDDLPRSIFIGMFGDWTGDTQAVEEIARPENGAVRTGPFGSQLLHSEFVDQGVAVLGIDNVVTNHFRWAERRYITPTKYEQLKRYTVAPGDVLISIMGTCGRCVVVPEGIETAINTKHLCAITVDRSKVLPEFVRASFLWHPESRRFLLRRAKGSIMDGLNMGIIKEMPMPVPPIALQATFVERVHAAHAQRDTAARSEGGISQLFDSLQQRAFSGWL
jgi:type I restriction enzyme S subunit